MKKILIISAVFPPEPVVSSTLSADLAKELATRNNVTVLSPRPSRPLGFKFEKSNLNEAFNHMVVPSYICPESNILGRFRESYSFGRAIVRYIKANYKEIDVMYANVWPLFAQYLTVKTARKYNIPVIVHVQDIYPESLSEKLPFLRPVLNFFLLPIDKYVLRNASKVIAISEKMKNYLSQTRNIDPAIIEIVQNWQDEAVFINYAASGKTIPRGTKPFTFMYMGNIGPVAGIELLIDAFAKAALNNSRLVIAGSGSMKEPLQRKAIEMKLDSVQFWPVPDGKVPETQSKADVMLLPIKKGAAGSSIPSKLPAYMFSGKPIIACVDEGSDTANAVISSGCGWALLPENLELLVEKMKLVVTLSEEELQGKGKNGFDYAIENLSKKKNLELLTSIIIETKPA